MAQSSKVWHPRFLEYMNFIINHPNYKGLPIVLDGNGPKWIATAQSSVGVLRKEWAESKAIALGIPIEPGVYAKVMYAVHPTKMKVCQICGEEMSVSYVYPGVNFSKSLIQKFHINIDIYDSMYDVWDAIISRGYEESLIVQMINNKFDTNFTEKNTKDEIIGECEILCRIGGKGYLSPGAMSNFPDRYDGFHTYNRCHRSLEDKGRSKENMKSYSKDRRAYEYWSDGNIMAANQFMGSSLYFNGLSADHVGPISLGFIHDSHYLRPMTMSENSAKRDRLSKDVVESLIGIHKISGVNPMSWYSRLIWDFIVNNYSQNEEKIGTVYRLLLKQNMSNYMYVLNTILNIDKEGGDFLIDVFISPKAVDFQYNYEFDEIGNIMSKTSRKITQRGSLEFIRFARIAIDAVREYNQKDNRNIPQNLTKNEQTELIEVTNLIKTSDTERAFKNLKLLMLTIQKRIISSVIVE